MPKKEVRDLVNKILNEHDGEDLSHVLGIIKEKIEELKVEEDG